MTSQSLRSPNQVNFRTPPWESWDKKPLDVGATKRCRECYVGEGDGFPQVQAVVSFVNLELLMACPDTKGVLESELTNLLVGLM
jgi:hypothetical protein